MEKLIELVRLIFKYKGYNDKVDGARIDEVGNLIRYTDWDNHMVGGLFTGVELKSKEYGFIKWLVENDKIDFEGKLNTLRFESLVDQTLDSYYALLMLLSIQDNSIDFLVSILK